MWYSNTQNDFSLGAAIFSLRTLASPSGRNMNYVEKQLTGETEIIVPSICTGFVNTCPSGFPIINVSNPGVHYETPCIIMINFTCSTVFFSLLMYQSGKSHVTKGLEPKESVLLNMAVIAKCERTSLFSWCRTKTLHSKQRLHFLLCR